MDRTPWHRRPDGIDDAYNVPAFKPTPSSRDFYIPPTIQSDFERFQMQDVPNHNYTFEILRDWYQKDAEGYQPEFLRGMFFSINWKSKVGNSDANSNFRTHLRVDIRKGDIVIREDGVIYLLKWQVQTHVNNQSTQAIDCNAFLEFYREGEEIVDERGYLVEEAGLHVVAPRIPCVYTEYAGRPDYATSYNTPGITPDHILTVQVQYNALTDGIQINDQFELMNSTYRVIHRLDREVDIDGTYGIINLMARRSAGEDHR